jgi:hypothetical protein
MRDDAEHMRSLGVVGLGFDRTARELVGIGQESMATLLFGDNQPGRAVWLAPAGRSTLRRVLLPRP